MNKTKLEPAEIIKVEFDEGYLQIFGPKLAKQIKIADRLLYGRSTGTGPKKGFYPYMVKLEDLKELKTYRGTIFKAVDPHTIARRTYDRGLEIIRISERLSQNFKGVAKLSKWEFQTVEAFL